MTLQSAQADANQEIMQAASSFMQAAVTLTTFAVQYTATKSAAENQYNKEKLKMDNEADFAEKDLNLAQAKVDKNNGKILERRQFEDERFNGDNLKDANGNRIKYDPDKITDINQELNEDDAAKYNAAIDKQNGLKETVDERKLTMDSKKSAAKDYAALKDSHIAQYMQHFANKNGYREISDMIQKAISGGLSIGVAAEKLVKGQIDMMMKMYSFYEQQYSKMQDHFSQEAKDARSGLDAIKQLLMRLQDTFQSPYV